MTKFILRFGMSAAISAGTVFFSTSVNAFDCGCDGPVCGCEMVDPGCGLEPGCGFEPDCGLEPGCGMPLACGCESIATCDCGVPACPPKRGPIYRTLDAFAGGIEKILGLDKCHSGGCDDLGCDYGCGMEAYAPMGHDIGSGSIMHAAPLPMTAPRIPAPIHHSQMAPRVSAPRSVAPQVSAPPATMPRTVAPRSVAPRSTSPRSSLEMTQPRIRSTNPRMAPRGEARRPAPIPRPEPPVDTRPEPKSNGGSLFDALEDPFGDDARVRRYQPVRPSSYQREVKRSSYSRRR